MSWEIHVTHGWIVSGGVALGLNVHHGLSLMSQSLIFCICPGFTMVPDQADFFF
jgi:hypothetical protein